MLISTKLYCTHLKYVTIFLPPNEPMDIETWLNSLMCGTNPHIPPPHPKKGVCFLSVSYARQILSRSRPYNGTLMSVPSTFNVARITSRRQMQQLLIINSLRVLMYGPLHRNISRLYPLYTHSNLSFRLFVRHRIVFYRHEQVSDCCLTPTQQFFSYIMVTTS